MTNADRIRSMSDEDMAEFLTDFALEAFAAGVVKAGFAMMEKEKRKEWLQQPVEEESHG